MSHINIIVCIHKFTKNISHRAKIQTSPQELTLISTTNLTKRHEIVEPQIYGLPRMFPSILSHTLHSLLLDVASRDSFPTFTVVIIHSLLLEFNAPPLPFM